MSHGSSVAATNDQIVGCLNPPAQNPRKGMPFLDLSPRKADGIANVSLRGDHCARHSWLRVTVGCNELPLNAAVEVEVMVEVN